MIERISELAFFGPEEQIRKFINHHDDPYILGDTTQSEITQSRIENIDDLLQKQLIWSYGQSGVDDAYFYWDWCPLGDDATGDKWQIETWEELQENLTRDSDRKFNYKEFKGYSNDLSSGDDMTVDYDATEDEHSREETSDGTTIDIETLRHNIMRSYIEVSEWLGDGATAYGSHNGYVSRKMSMCWLFDSIRALINFKMGMQDKYAEKDIYPLDVGDEHKEKFLDKGQVSECGVNYEDYLDLGQMDGRCARQIKARSKNPNTKGTLKVRGNAWFYGERADFYTHNSFMGECRFFHNTRFLGQATFDKEINGTAVRARWGGDVSELYESDQQYEPGTLVMFGGQKEITKSNGKVCNAIITSKPGIILNGGDKPGKLMIGIALVGRVPVRVVGNVNRFDKIVSDSNHPGFARRKHWYDFFKPVIGVALSDSSNGVVECVVKLKI